MAKKDALKIVQSNNKFATTIYSLLKEEAEGENVFFSPVSLHTSLAMLHQGSEGATLSALSTALGLPDKARSQNGFELVTNGLNNLNGVTLEIANKLYFKKSCAIKEPFTKIIVAKFNAAVENVDFSANKKTAKAINTWVEAKTHDKIKDLIDEKMLSSLTMCVIVNAIYFKGVWQNKFNKENTMKEPFFSTPDDPVNVDMMHIRTHFNYKEISKLDAQVVSLPYTNPKFSMVVVLPNHTSNIDDLGNRLKNYDLTKLTNDLKRKEVHLAMPRFKFETNMDLIPPLKKAGLQNLFTDDCNLSGLSDESLLVSTVVQKAFIEVNEEGSEASAATATVAVKKSRGSKPPKIIKVILDRPFIFAIFCDSNVLFYGKILKL